MSDKEHIEDIFSIFEKNNVSIVMKSKSDLIDYVIPDDDYDFHAYRILLLINKCGVLKDHISKYPFMYGRTKFAFYDFLIRYPFYLEKVIRKIAAKAKSNILTEKLSLRTFEKGMAFSTMVKYLKGPWDPKYDNILSYLISKQLLNVRYASLTDTDVSDKRQFIMELTNLGFEISSKISNQQPLWVSRMEIITSLFPQNTTENYIEKKIKELFPELVL